jgi:hypothetical protein
VTKAIDFFRKLAYLHCGAALSLLLVLNQLHGFQLSCCLSKNVEQEKL